MSDKSQNVVITKAARQKLVRARAGAIELPKIVGMAFGNGGVDAAGNIIAPGEGQTVLVNELYRKPVDGYSFPDDTICRYECTLTEQELAGEEISEIGLYDEDGDIIAIKAFKRKGKDNDIAQTYILDDIF
ncbi:MAG: hypothetical protein HFH87_05590 [Lachnospiraceae bacterium]|nr:hypothetical protein [Lachnospiraceae bacterium]